MKPNDKIPEGNPFKLPENYFKEVNKKIISATAGNDMHDTHKSFRISLRQFLAIAASVAVLALLTYTGSVLFSPGHESLSLNDNPSETYPEELVNDIDLIVLEENAVSLDIPEGRSGMNNQDIVDYLVQEDIDINDIYEQL
jgi:hypothetical protein